MEAFIDQAAKVIMSLVFGVVTFVQTTLPMATSTHPPYQPKTPAAVVKEMEKATTTTVVKADTVVEIVEIAEPVATSTETIVPKTHETVVVPAPTAPKPAAKPATPPKPTPVVTPAVVATPPKNTALTDSAITALATTSLKAGPLTFDDINTLTREALVNILCYTQTSGPISPITGSGVIIDPRGVILTNAHIAQYFLLKDYGMKDYVSCNIRTGNPAVPKYKATLLYISPRWVKNNSDNIKRQEAKGTGEDDFAFLIIDRGLNAEQKLPSSFPYLPIDSIEHDYANESVLVAGYGAGFLGGEEIQRNLYGISAIATVKEMLSYSGSTLDYLNINGNAVAQRGSSGGAVVDSKGALVGVISTVSSGTQTDTRELGSIGLSHINDSLLKQSGSDIPSFLNTNLTEKAAQFNSLIAPTLVNVLLKSIGSDTPARY
ncbi:MAG: serine protease [Patescibacteria group bacterium]